MDYTPEQQQDLLSRLNKAAELLERQGRNDLAAAIYTVMGILLRD